LIAAELTREVETFVAADRISGAGAGSRARARAKARAEGSEV